ncbi:hypothetical protein [Xenorhabdus thuongxuanensis]|uniref:hypothetical protein n=1 Tax=Xenorhabdus thuongxuanensis TaxID=1873484 RepID=UPI0011149007|nr:hypothetical protein [Xenorhabdus thuongxuanensis]
MLCECKVFKYFDNAGGKDHPHTIFSSLRGELRETENSGSFYDDKKITDIVYSLPADKNQSPYGKEMLTFGDKKSGAIQFNAYGTAEINTKVTMKSGEIKLYKYESTINNVSDINPQYKRYLSPSPNITCIDNSSNSTKRDFYSDKEVYDPDNPIDFYSLYNEWGGKFDLYDWGIFDKIDNKDPNKATIIVRNTGSDSQSKPFRVYDSKNNTFDKQTEGIIFCYQIL